jgi:guanylate kinase
MVFLEPPSWHELARRLAGRGTESDVALSRRLDTARAELAAKAEFDVAVVNDDLGRVVRRLVELVTDPELRGPPDPAGPDPIGPDPGAPSASSVPRSP